ncbi:TetR/AcrR family transcriptional regulator [Desulforamulus ruminis]|uniref:Regulatory protein TetR n=1 Tax=Desulforamulus ruminis (strain ATCC 23193 / DSM 2154 / NCIMB 8452 / DL) TaxID=696281 RepID=F6DQZ9_DESRL|nr:TetR/AcrR family transcriptional regulator [Desulforamulus ruminis]AEG59718.1 regulatory protein TetR [Desulforamulus ruminis DSM 2154]
MRARVEREREFRRESIIKATEELLNEKAFESITMDDIAEKSDFAKASIYQYFKNKDELMSEVFSKCMETQCNSIKERCLSLTAPEQAIRNYIMIEFEFIHQHPWVPKVSATIPFEGFNAESRLIDLYNQKKRLLAAIIQRGQAEGTFIESDLVVLTNMILSVSIGFVSYISTHMSADLKSPVTEMMISTITKGMTRGSSNESNRSK